jgi:hypothetical protein
MAPLLGSGKAPLYPQPKPRASPDRVPLYLRDPLMFNVPSLDVSADTALSIAGMDLIPAGVAAAVLISLGIALVITSLRRKDSERH